MSSFQLFIIPCPTPQVSDRRRDTGSGGERRSELAANVGRSSGAAVRLERVVRRRPHWLNPESHVLGGSEVACESRTSLCQERLSHCGHFMNEKVRDWLAFQRIPPNSQMDRAKPHEHCILHERESASMLSAHLRGRTRTRNF